MCPRDESQMPEKDLAFSDLKGIIETVPSGSLIDLNGWGEPLLYPHLVEAVALLKTHGCFVGFSTNGLLLTEKKALRLIDAGIDYLAFSLDGASDRTYETVRGGNFEKVYKNIESLIKIRPGVLAPQVSITFVMLKTNLDDVLDMVRLAARLEVDFIRLKKVDVFTQTDYDQLTYDFDDPYNPDAGGTHKQTEILEKALSLGEKLGVGVQVPRIAERGLPFCWMEPEHTIFVNSSGQLAPCCILGHSSIRFLNDKNSQRFPPFIFADFQNGLSTFDFEQYSEFYYTIKEGKIPHHCLICPKITPKLTDGGGYESTTI